MQRVTSSDQLAKVAMTVMIAQTNWRDKRTPCLVDHPPTVPWTGKANTARSQERLTRTDQTPPRTGGIKCWEIMRRQKVLQGKVEMRPCWKGAWHFMEARNPKKTRRERRERKRRRNTDWRGKNADRRKQRRREKDWRKKRRSTRTTQRIERTALEMRTPQRQPSMECQVQWAWTRMLLYLESLATKSTIKSRETVRPVPKKARAWSM
mmetsp:Transcript_42543/g.68468  ORF Transcript_42543/g.68468 Transcript_42543/m.68468 type:complete len:208 (+) Transcript_42543:451-1074(+)